MAGCKYALFCSLSFSLFLTLLSHLGMPALWQRCLSSGQTGSSLLSQALLLFYQKWPRRLSLSCLYNTLFLSLFECLLCKRKVLAVFISVPTLAISTPVMIIQFLHRAVPNVFVIFFCFLLYFASANSTFYSHLRRAQV